jgi:hypothetical protein
LLAFLFHLLFQVTQPVWFQGQLAVQMISWLQFLLYFFHKSDKAAVWLVHSSRKAVTGVFFANVIAVDFSCCNFGDEGATQTQMWHQKILGEVTGGLKVTDLQWNRTSNKSLLD